MAIVSPVPVTPVHSNVHSLLRSLDSRFQVSSTFDFDDLLECLEHLDADGTTSPPPAAPLAARCGEEADTSCSTSSRYMPSARGTRETLLVLDYDNTLFPTKYFERNRRLIFADVDSLPARFRRSLAKLDVQMAEFVEDAARRCRVAVVTAASRQWIEFSSMKFMPKLAAAVHALSIDVVCASEEYADIMEAYPQPFCYVATKREAFRVLMARYMTHRIVSIGDSSWERRACLGVDATYDLDHLLSDVILPRKVHIPKISLQIIPRSTPGDLSIQFDKITSLLDILLTSDESYDLKMAVDDVDPRQAVVVHQEQQLV